ncbi:MAG: Cystathionine beta-synthase [uncultured Acetobacteraceae bacterium]|uniref:Cystathionine beta-synthase n=1 Tax=uncultured Acetobacteraceae bacterium TaxID=169975 RepID=A0A6J4HQP6_9PROT|nr:MAG: Cystathionine beta-synthase [uncultured Acetobacteraceae bacterium]
MNADSHPTLVPVVDGFAGAVGQTPLIRLRRASEATGCEILGKAEFMNPGGSVKDRAALGIIEDAERRGALIPGEPGTVVEGTAGNTGIGLTLAANARGYRSIIVVPETQSREKIDFLRMIGADLRLIPAKPYRDPGHYVHFSRRIAEEMAAAGERVVWANQFGNLANARAHEDTTGPEIWDRTDGRVDAFTCSCGTGGTLAGVGRFLKNKKPGVRIVLADPMGSGLHSWVKTGEMKAEGNSITEGIGQASNVPGNLEGARGVIDDAVQVPDPEALEQVFDLLQHEGLSIGGSAGINVAAAIRVARAMGPGHTVVTILCDGGARYQSKLFNPDFLRERNLPVPSWLT